MEGGSSIRPLLEDSSPLPGVPRGQRPSRESIWESDSVNHSLAPVTFAKSLFSQRHTAEGIALRWVLQTCSLRSSEGKRKTGKEAERKRVEKGERAGNVHGKMQRKLHTVPGPRMKK